MEQNDVLAEPAHPLDGTRWLTGASSMPVYVGCSHVSFVTPWPVRGRGDRLFSFAYTRRVFDRIRRLVAVPGTAEVGAR